MTVTLRDAAAADLAAITRIYAEAVLTGTASYELVAPDEVEMMARFEATTRQGYPYIVAVDPTGTVLGYAYVSAFRTRPAYRWLVEDSIYIAAKARGRGIGKLLLEALVQRATALGFRQMVAVIGGASLASIAVHRACGNIDRDRIQARPMAGYRLHADRARRWRHERSRSDALSGHALCGLRA